MRRRFAILLTCLGPAFTTALAIDAPGLPGTAPLTGNGDLAADMVSAIDRYLDGELARAVASRNEAWQARLAARQARRDAPPNTPGPDLHLDWMLSAAETNRVRLREILGVVDAREPVTMRFVAAVPATNLAANAAEIARGPGYRIYAVAWNVFRGVEGEGLLLQPDGVPKADLVALPDCDWTPEQLVGLQPGVPADWQYARRFAEYGCRVLVPALIDRTETNAGNPRFRRVRHSQRETLWRASYELGRTLAGYEIQKVLAAADWLVATRQGLGEPAPLPDWFKLRATAPRGLQSLGLFGYGEGGLVAFHAAALDPRFRSVAVSGYFGPREKLHAEPIYRNTWSLLPRFGDAEVAQLILPRALFLEHGRYPEIEHPDAHGGAPGRLWQPSDDEVRTEMDRAQTMAGGEVPIQAIGVRGAVGDWATVGRLYRDLQPQGDPLPQQLAAPPQPTGPLPDNAGRQRRQYLQILDDTQQLLRDSDNVRREFWKQADFRSAAAFTNTTAFYRDYFRTHIVGVIPPASLPPNPRTRLLYETNGYRGYEVVLDVHPDLFASGILLVPDRLDAAARRPVVVCQHGLEGRPRDVADPRVPTDAYRQFACRLAERGFVTFAPQNPYVGGTRFRQLLRKSQPLGLTLWSFVVRQHEVITDWLAAQDFVDPQRIAFYGLSYGGKTAMRVPALMDRYCLSICSADYNQWLWKNVAADASYSYLWTPEYDMPEFNLAATFNYAELSWLLFPRPFMVERGHHDGVAPDEWVAYEYARTRRLYVTLGRGDQTEIEFFNGPHAINGQGTFDFLHRHLRWPKP